VEVIPQAIPDEIDALLKSIIQDLKQILAAELIGVYLHGSLAMGRFNPKSSDVDLLILVDGKISTAAKRKIAKSLIMASEKAPPKGIELSIVTLEAVQEFKYPTPFEFHFSTFWKDRYVADAVDLEEQRFDPDLAAHFMMTLSRGICLFGRPIKDAFREIPTEYFLRSILADAHEILENIIDDPVYGVLNLCRVMAYVRAKQLTSKVEGGEWGLKHVEQQYTALIRKALDAYENQNSAESSWDKTDLENFAQYMSRVLTLNISE
jgi:streptomycin 3"-adenylyltransferase